MSAQSSRPSSAPSSATSAGSDQPKQSAHGHYLDRLPRLHGINTAILGGIATNWVVKATAMDASDLGYRVIVPEACSASITAEIHLFAIEKVLPDIATISTADDLMHLRGAVMRLGDPCVLLFDVGDKPRVAQSSGRVWTLLSAIVIVFHLEGPDGRHGSGRW
jgi:hypothetical protein